MKQLSPLDASFVYQEQGNQYMHVAGLMIYDPSTVPLDKKRKKHVFGHKDILEAIGKTLHLAPNMRRRLVRVPGDLDHPYWIEDDHFNIEFHVRHIALPSPGDWQQLCILIARLHARPLDMSRPLWEIYIIEGLDNIPSLPKGCFATLTKVHHAAIDGATGADQMAGMHTLKPTEDPLEDHEDWTPERAPAPAELLARTYWRGLTAPLTSAEMLWKGFGGLARAARGLVSGEFRLPTAAPRTIFNARVSPHRVFDSRVFSLDDLRAVKRGIEGATINDVILTICGGALRAYLRSRNELPDRPLVAMIPINTRSEDEKSTGGNMVSSMTAAIGTDIADPLERLKAIQENSRNAKTMMQAIGAREMVDMLGLTPPLVHRARLPAGLADRLEPLCPANLQCRHHQCSGAAGFALHGRRAPDAPLQSGPGRAWHGRLHRNPEL